jgi:hypothetical protein
MKQLKRMIFVVMALSFVISSPCMAIDNTPDNLLSLVKLMPGTTTMDNVTFMFGKPAKVEESKKSTKWYYNNGATNLVVCWDNKSALLSKFSFKSDPATKSVFDKKQQSLLKSGTTDISQAIKLLGMPLDMNIRENTQEIHYAFQHNVLRLFFRDRVLVDFCLISNQ